ncbi:MAG: hypothetical protein EU541_02915 [Promethearchaeota archaeon]|nr:MAG: hypothetical protein EU541_02915 [Candidatus Lokiarchaeota archaeon]
MKSLKLASGLTLTFLFALVYALVFVISVWFLPFAWWSLLIMIGFTLGIVLMQYGISPYIIQWVYQIDWIPYEQYKRQYPHLAETLEKVVDVNNIDMPRLGIIHDMNPNAFTFGHTKNNARVVLTDGILNFLNEEEQKAVLAHELGHVIHSDFILMTIVFAIPMIFLTIARWAYYSSLFRRIGRDEEGGYMVLVMIAIAILSFICYYIGYFLSLVISRIREYYADEHAAEVLENPNALSTGLVKIAYGLISSQNKSIEERNKSKVRAIKGLGIFDPNSASMFAVESMGKSGGYSKEAIQAAAAWDLYNPWAKYYQLHSSHPLPARRIQRLNKQCEQYGLQPEIDFSDAKELKRKQAGRSMMGEFLTDLLFKSLPTLILTGFILFSIIWLFDIVGFYSLPIVSSLGLSQMVFLWAVCFYLIAFGFIARTLFRYRSGFKPYEVVDLLTKVKASPIRCIPAVIEGKIIGKGVPGYYISDDLYFQDDTGILYVDYRFGLSIVDFFWAIRRASQMVGQNVRIIGWYRRGPMPYIQVKELQTMGKTYKNHTKGLSYVWAVLAFLIGIGIFLLWFFVFL